jgi:hypothetical protein
MMKKLTKTPSCIHSLLYALQDLPSGNVNNRNRSWVKKLSIVVFLALLTAINVTGRFRNYAALVLDYKDSAALGYSNILYMNLPTL